MSDDQHGDEPTGIDRVGVAKRQLRHARRRTEQTLTRLARRRTVAERALPDFLIIGAQKAATTTLFGLLAEHPRVIPPRRKELAVLDRDGTPPTADGYRLWFPRRSELRQGDGSGPALTGEATPCYMLDRRVAHRVDAIFGTDRPRCIALLRDPASRAWSNWWMSRRQGREHLGFLDALAAEEERLAPWRADPLADHPAPEDSWRWHSYVERGAYGAQLEHWTSVLGTDDLLVLRFEDLAREPQETYDRALAFLGLPAFTPSSFVARNVGRIDDDIPAAGRRFVEAALAEDGARLDALLDDHPELLG